MSEVTIKTRKFLRNPLLQRRQMVIANNNAVRLGGPVGPIGVHKPPKCRSRLIFPLSPRSLWMSSTLTFPR